MKSLKYFVLNDYIFNYKKKINTKHTDNNIINYLISIPCVTKYHIV